MGNCYNFLVIRRLYIAVTAIVMFGLSMPGYGQDAPEFNIDVVSLKSDRASVESRLDLYTRIPYAQLRFLNTSEGFTASYQVSADIIELDSQGKRANHVQSPIWDHTVRVTNYADTQAGEQYDFTTQSLTLPPGRYLIEIQIEDKSSSESYVSEVSVEVKDFSKAVAVSDVLILEDFDKNTNTISSPALLRALWHARNRG